MQQRSEEWFRARAGKFTGSRFSDLMAKTRSGPAASRRNLIVTLAVERVTQQCVETYTNAAMQRGIDLEAQAREAYEIATGAFVTDAAFIDHPTLPMCGVSPDGLIGDVGLVEVKCPASMAKHWEALEDAAHVAEYRWQLVGQLMVTGRQWVDAVSYDPRFPAELQLAVYRVHRDEKAITELSAEIVVAEREVREIVERMHERQQRRAEAA